MIKKCWFFNFNRFTVGKRTHQSWMRVQSELIKIQPIFQTKKPRNIKINLPQFLSSLKLTITRRVSLMSLKACRSRDWSSCSVLPLSTDSLFFTTIHMSYLTWRDCNSSIRSIVINHFLRCRRWIGLQNRFFNSWKLWIKDKN